MPRMCKDKRWFSSREPDEASEATIEDGTITISEENETSQVVKGKHNLGGTEVEINGTCDHGNPAKSFVKLRRREDRVTPRPHTVTIHYSGEVVDGDEDISAGRYRVVGGLIDPEEGTWVATTSGGDLHDKKEKKEKKEKASGEYTSDQTR